MAAVITSAVLLLVCVITRTLAGWSGQICGMGYTYSVNNSGEKEIMDKEFVQSMKQCGINMKDGMYMAEHFKKTNPKAPKTLEEFVNKENGLLLKELSPAVWKKEIENGILYLFVGSYYDGKSGFYSRPVGDFFTFCSPTIITEEEAAATILESRLGEAKAYLASMVGPTKPTTFEFKLDRNDISLEEQANMVADAFVQNLLKGLTVAEAVNNEAEVGGGVDDEEAGKAVDEKAISPQTMAKLESLFKLKEIVDDVVKQSSILQNSITVNGAKPSDVDAKLVRRAYINRMREQMAAEFQNAVSSLDATIKKQVAAAIEGDLDSDDSNDKDNKAVV